MRSISILKDLRTKPHSKDSRFLKGGDFLDPNCFRYRRRHSTIEYRWNLFQSRKRFYATLSNVETGELEVCKPNKNNLKSVIMATSALPLVVRNPVQIKNKKYLDGNNYADSNTGCNRFRSHRNLSYSISSQRLSKRWTLLQASIVAKRSMPKMVEALLRRADVYNSAVELIENPTEPQNSANTASNHYPVPLGGDIDINRDYLLGVEMAKAYIAQTHREYRLESLRSKR